MLPHVTAVEGTRWQITGALHRLYMCTLSVQRLHLFAFCVTKVLPPFSHCWSAWLHNGSDGSMHRSSLFPPDLVECESSPLFSSKLNLLSNGWNLKHSRSLPEILLAASNHFTVLVFLRHVGLWTLFLVLADRSDPAIPHMHTNTSTPPHSHSLDSC